MEKPERKTFLGAVRIFWKTKRKQNVEESKEAHKKFERHDVNSKRQNMDTKWMEKEIKRSRVACVSESVYRRRKKAKADVEMIK